MPLKTTSAHTPADGYVLPGCIALVQHLHAQKIEPTHALLLLHLVREEDHELHEEEVMRILGLDLKHQAWDIMGALDARGWCVSRAAVDEQECIALTTAGEVECMAMFGAVMIAGHALVDQ